MGSPRPADASEMRISKVFSKEVFPRMGVGPFDPSNNGTTAWVDLRGCHGYHLALYCFKESGGFDVPPMNAEV